MQKIPNLLKTHTEKMSTFRLSTISMKTNKLPAVFHDVDEKQGVRRFAGKGRNLNFVATMIKDSDAKSGHGEAARCQWSVVRGWKNGANGERFVSSGLILVPALSRLQRTKDN